MDKNIIEGVKSGVSGHNIAKPCHSALDVNGAVGQRRLLTYGDLTGMRPRGNVLYGNTWDDQREVSRSHSSESKAGG